jgi:ATP/maltotriose-dependent transcriptional regulator MalT
VTRLLDTPPAPSSAAAPQNASNAAPHPDLEGSERYRIHPLLLEVVRRHILAGGVAVAQAQATVRRAVLLDAARGDLSKALTRLVALNEPTEAASVVAEHGPTLLMQGQGAAIAAFAQHYPTQVEANPRVWFAIALERWFSDDIATAAHWLDRRALRLHEHGGDEEPGVEIACIRLFRALLGSESAADAAAHAQIVVSRSLRTSRPQPLLPLLLSELGMVRAHLGHLRQAEVNLTAGVALSRAHGMVPLTLSGLSHLALALYIQGRERASIEVANEVLLAPGARVPWLPRFALDRAQIVHDLATMSDLPSLTSHGLPFSGIAHEPAVHSGDALTQYWARIRQSRLELAAGSVVTAEQMLQVPASGLPVPEHMRVCLLIERGFLASMGADGETLRSLADELSGLRAPGEAALLEGLSHELEGERSAALAAYERAEALVTYAQPATRALALTCAAQLLDALGSRTDAIERLHEAATITEVRRNAVPFLGWSRQGTPIGALLDRLLEDVPSDWINDLAELARQSPSISTALAPSAADLRERVRAAEVTVAPTLSARERDVLNELARGATYADIAASLFVSENTVKTHVSSLYGKLGATRRSEALAAARNQHLL